MTVVVFQVITLIFQRVEGFVLDFPASTPGAHHLRHVIGSYGEVSDAGIGKGFSVWLNLPIINKIDLQFLVFMVRRYTVSKPVAPDPPLSFICSNSIVLPSDKPAMIVFNSKLSLRGLAVIMKLKPLAFSVLIWGSLQQYRTIVSGWLV